MVAHTSSHTWLVPALVTGCLVASAAPAFAAHARLSADLADHVAAGSQAIEVIVHGDKATVDRLAARYNLSVYRYLHNAAVLRVTAGQLAALQNDDEVDHLSGNIRIKSAIDASMEAIGADQVWAGLSGLPTLTGKGVTVAVVDSGMDANHLALRGRVLYTQDFTGGGGEDLYGHGTHVAALIAGQRGTTPETSEYQGVAPGAYLINLRVLGPDGSGEVADVLEAIDWAVDHRKQFNIGVINLSLGAPVLQPYRDDPLCEAVDRAVRAGIAVVAAAGNQGLDTDGNRVYGGITSPGNSPLAITVGALDTKGTADRSDDEVANFSSRGPTTYDLVLKPDVVAPGRRVASAEAEGSYLSQLFPQRHVAGAGPTAYIQGSGSSMATAVVSGVVAVLLEEQAKLKPLEAQAVLEATSTFLPAAGLVGGGAGSVSLAAAAELLEGNDRGNREAVLEKVDSGLVVASTGKAVDRTVISVSDPTWGAGKSIIWGAGNWAASGSAKSVVWGGSDSVIWGSGKSIIWGAAKSVIWGSSKSVIWGGSNSIIWGAEESDELITPSVESDAGSVVWGNSDTSIWSASNCVISGSNGSIIWGA